MLGFLPKSDTGIAPPTANRVRVTSGTPATDPRVPRTVVQAEWFSHVYLYALEALKTICGPPTALPRNGGNLLPDFRRAWWWLDLSWYTTPRLGSQGLYAPCARERRCWEICYPRCDRVAMVTAPAILAARTQRSSRDRRVGPGSSRSRLRVEESSRWH
jgi:hypothetical protein